MYGSNFYLEQSLTTKRFSTTELASFVPAQKSEKTKIWMIAGFITLILSVSTMSFAGSSQPKLKGKNGDANGR